MIRKHYLLILFGIIILNSSVLAQSTYEIKGKFTLYNNIRKLALIEIVCIATIPQEGTKVAPVYVKFRIAT